jgi:cell wall-associated NlpC family hydrolase
VSGRRLAFAAAAESFVGSPFRFRGRDSKTGLDCVGLVAAALSQLGDSVPELAPYSMRQRDFDVQLGRASVAGFAEVVGLLEAGDLLLLRPGPAQVHLAIVGGSAGLVHAHAGLGRVVMTPLPCPMPIERHWRLRED